MGKKKKQAEAAMQQNNQQSAVVDEFSTHKKLSDSAKTRKEIENRFWELKNKAARGEFNRKANDNRLILEKYDQIEALNEENRSKLAEYERDILIVSSDYPGAPRDAENRPMNGLDKYITAIRLLESKFNATGSADAVAVGADRLLSRLVRALDAFMNALETGNALKANASIDMIKYVLTIGYRHEDYDNETERELGIQRKEEFLDETCKNLIKAADQQYQLVVNYRLEEDRYSKALRTYIEKIEEYDRTCPDEVKQLIDRLGFKSVRGQLKPGDPRMNYVNLLLELQLDLVPLLVSSMMLTAYLKELVGIKAGVDSLTHEMRKAFSDNGKQFNFDEHMRAINAINQNNIHTMDDANKHALALAHQAEEVNAELERITEDIRTGEAAAIASIAVRDMEYIRELEKRLREQEAAQQQKYIVEKKKAQLAEETRKNEELQQQVNEIMNLDEQIDQTIQNNIELQYQIDTMNQNQEAETNTVEPNDNRELNMVDA